MSAKLLMMNAKQAIDPVIENQRVEVGRAAGPTASALPGPIGLMPPPCPAGARRRPAGLGNPRGLPPLGVVRLTHEADFDLCRTAVAKCQGARGGVWGMGSPSPARDVPPGIGARA
jgi:hypothetical protein